MRPFHKRPLQISCFLLGLISSVQSASSQTPPTFPSGVDCSSSEEKSYPLGRWVCADGEVERLSIQINQTYRALQTAADQAERGRLQQANKAWLDEVDAKCVLDPSKRCILDAIRSRLVQLGVRPVVKPTVAAQSTGAGGSPTVFPAAVAAAYSKEEEGKARMHTCMDQYNYNKATNGNGGLKWIQQGGGGYYSICVERLKSVVVSRTASTPPMPQPAQQPRQGMFGLQGMMEGRLPEPPRYSPPQGGQPPNVVRLAAANGEDAGIVSQMIGALQPLNIFMSGNCSNLEYLGGDVEDRSIEGMIGVFIVRLQVRNLLAEQIVVGSPMSDLCVKLSSSLAPGQVGIGKMRGLYRKYSSGWRLENVIRQ